MKLRMKVAEHEFECDASFQEVQRRYSEWRQLLRELEPGRFFALPSYAIAQNVEAEGRTTPTGRGSTPEEKA